MSWVLTHHLPAQKLFTKYGQITYQNKLSNWQKKFMKRVFVFAYHTNLVGRYACYRFQRTRLLIMNWWRSVPGFPGRLLFFLIFWGCCWGEMLERPWVSPPRSWTFVPEETLASSDKEVELEIAVGNMLPLKKTSNWVGVWKRRKARYDVIFSCLGLFVGFRNPSCLLYWFHKKPLLHLGTAQEDDKLAEVQC